MVIKKTSMLNKLKYAALLVLCITLFSGCSHAKEENMTQVKGLSLVISCDKEEYKVGDKINIKYSLVSNSNDDIFLWTLGGSYTFRRLFLYDSTGKRVDAARLLVARINFRPFEKKEITTLSSGKTIDFYVEGEIFLGNLEFGSQKIGAKGEMDHHDGLSIVFIDSAYLLDSPGEYTFQAVFECEEKIATYTKEKFSIDNLWYGKILSNKVKILIKEE